MAGPCNRGDLCVWVKRGKSESLQVSVDVLLVGRTEGRVLVASSALQSLGQC